MKKSLFLLTIFCFINPLKAEPPSQVLYPELAFTYDWRSHIIDTIGRFYFGVFVTAERRDQLRKQLPDFIAAWEKAAPIFFGEIFSVFNRGFKSKTRTAIVYLSHNSCYGSQWFLIFGLRYDLDPEPWLSSISREDSFCDRVFHELLHLWVDENINKSSSLLLAKYSGEDYHAREHLHLMALQKMVYLKINRLDLLGNIDNSYRHLSWPAYRRAWEIVNDIERYETVLADIAISLTDK